MILQVSQYAKAIAALVPGVALFLTNVLTEVTGVTEDGVIDVNETYVLIGSIITAVTVLLAPKNAEPVA